jgi:uncharacterized protein (TIGR02001 family)
MGGTAIGKTRLRQSTVLLRWAVCVALSQAVAPGAWAQQSATPVSTAAAPTATPPARAPIDLEIPSGTSGSPASTTGIPLGKTGLTLSGLAMTANDYLFRGISQTRNNWAFQGVGELSHSSGFYVGTFVSNAKFLGDPWNDTRQEVDALIGYRFTLAGLNLDAGWIGYFYPGEQKAQGTQLNEYQEAALKVSYTVDKLKLLGAFNFSPNWFGHSGKGYYLEAGGDLSLPWSLTGGFRIGRQWIERNAVFGTPDYLWYSVGISREVFPGSGVTAALGWYTTNISKQQCIPFPNTAPDGQRICASRALFSLSKAF